MSDGNDIRPSGGKTPVSDVLRSAVEPMSPDARERVRSRVVAAPAPSTVISRTRTSAVRAAAVFATLTLVMAGVAVASSDSLPGNTLYPVKLAIERVHIALTSSERRQADVYSDIAEERIREIERLMNSSASARAVNKAVEGFGDAARSAVDLEPDEVAAERRAEEIRKRAEEAPAAVRDFVESELRQLGPQPADTPPVRPNAPSEQPDSGDANQEKPSSAPAPPAPPAPPDSSRDEGEGDGQGAAAGVTAVDGLLGDPTGLSRRDRNR